MAPAPITEDYYIILGVEQNATPELINRSYKRLALKLHPDRNAKHDATEVFQLLVRAYETLKDESERRAYDRIYPSIKRSGPSPQTPRTSGPPPASTPQPGPLSEAAQIVALQKSKQERGARWTVKKNAFDSSIFELSRDIRRLEQEIKDLVAAEAAEDAQKNSWGTWLLSPIYKKAEDSEEEKARKDRVRQERRIEKDMKGRRLVSKQADLKKEESQLRIAREEIFAADLACDRKIRTIQERRWAREALERQERERVERMILKQQQEQREREAAEALKKRQAEARAATEALRKRQAESRAAAEKQQEESARNFQKIIDERNKRLREQYTRLNHHDDYSRPEESPRQASSSTCRHDGWWPKIQGRTACLKCGEVWTYLLQCPGCKMKACPRCQASIRPRLPNRRVPPRVRPPSPAWAYDFYD